MTLTARRLFPLALALAGCSPSTGSDLAATGGSTSFGGSGGSGAATGGAAAGGATTGGASAAGGQSAGGSLGSGGAGSGGAASGGAASGGSPSGGAASGGTASSGGQATGGAPGSGGAENLDAIAEAIDGLRLDDPCTGTPDVSVGATCDHAVLTGLGFLAEEPVSIGGDPGTTYAVTLRVRGVVEPTNVSGGERPSTETFPYMGLDWRTEPLTLGGTVPVDDTDYAQWRILIDEPAAEYTLNDYQRVGHYIFELDYEVTVLVQGGSTLTLSAVDANERLIVNYEGYAPEGIEGSVNHGQFVELELVSVSVQ